MVRHSQTKRPALRTMRLFSVGVPVLLAINDFSIFETASPTSESIRDLSWLVLGITGFIFVVVEGLILYCIYHFRQRKTDTVSQSEAPADGIAKDEIEPPQIYGSMPIEMAWTVAPLLIVFVLFLVVVRTIGEVKNEPPVNEKSQRTKVVAIGHQWWWEYRYLDAEGKELFRTANELHFPITKRFDAEPADVGMQRFISLDLQSADVVHSYWFPRLSGKTDMIPGQANKMWFQTKQPGVYLGQCAEFCGTQHAAMLLWAKASEESKFTDWFNNQKKDALQPEPDTDAYKGQQLFLSLSCVNCHTIRGTTAKKADGIYGPDLTHFASRETLAALNLSWKAEHGKITGEGGRKLKNLEVWLLNPDNIKPGSWMPNFKLTEQQVKLLVAYLSSLK